MAAVAAIIIDSVTCSYSSLSSFFLLLQGGDLSNMIKQVREAGKVLEESLILDWFVQLTNAVRYIHHRSARGRGLLSDLVPSAKLY